MMFSESEILQFLETNGSISIDKVSEQYAMKRTEEILENHKFKIWYSETNKVWYTYLPDEKKGRVLKKRSTEEKLKKMIVEFYVEQTQNPTIQSVFDAWIQNKLFYKEIQKGTADRYTNDFIRFFQNTGFADKKIKGITEDDLEEFIRVQIAELELTMKAYSGLRLIIGGIWKYAKKNKWTTVSISQFFGDLELSRTIFKKVVKEREKQVFSEIEVPILAKYLKSNPTIYNLGILLALETGIRVGELSALKHCDWDGGNILKIRRTEIRYKNESGKNVLVVREYAKTDAGMRDIILNQYGKETMQMILALHSKEEYLFIGTYGKRIRGTTFNKYLDIVLERIKFHHRSMHKIRRTYGTTLIDAGCEDSLVMNQMGHTSADTTRKYYYYSNRTREHQIEKIQEAITV